MPSFFNGIFGHKPSPDVVPNIGQFPDATGNRQQFLCTGPMCRYAEDLKPLLKVSTVSKQVHVWCHGPRNQLLYLLRSGL